MPQLFNNAVITDGGAALLAMAQAGQAKVKFTRMAVGDGVYAAAEKDMRFLQAATRLKAERNSYHLSGIEVVSGHSVKLTALITNQDPATSATLIDAGYYINELGIFAKPDVAGGQEVLYSIAVTAGDHGDYMPPYNGYHPAQIIQDYYVTVDNSAEAVIQAGTGAVALAEDLQVLKEQVEQHAAGNDREFARIWGFLGDLYCLAVEMDIDNIIGGTYVDDDTTGGGFFEVGTDGDIDAIINGSYVGADTGTGGGGAQGGVTGQMITEIVDNAFREV